MTASSPATKLKLPSVPPDQRPHARVMLSHGMSFFVPHVGLRLQASGLRARLRVCASFVSLPHVETLPVGDAEVTTGAIRRVGKPFSELGTSAHERRR